MSEAQQLATAHQALSEISTLCSGAFLHGADSNGVAEILEAISAKARGAMARHDAKCPAIAEKATCDGEGYILGLGQTWDEARKNAVKTVLGDRTETEKVVKAAVEDMDTYGVSADLAAEVRKHGGDVGYRSVPIAGGSRVLVTVGEHAAFCAAEGAR